MKNEKFYNEVFKGLEDHNFTGYSLIHATMLNKDLIPVFMEFLSLMDPEKAKELNTKYPEMEKACKELAEDSYKNIPYFESEESSYFLNEVLFDVLDSYSPEGFYFGANEGDLSDFGYWLTEEMYEVYYNNNWL